MNESFQHDDARFIDLLQRWSAGDFTRADEQELYALARSDEHRREALEGFMAVPDHEHQVQIESLRQKLQEQIGSKRRILPISVIMSVAAGIVLLIIAIVAFPMLKQSEAPQVSMDTAPVATKPDATVTQTDQGPPAAQAPAATQPSAPSEAAKKMSGGPALDKMPENHGKAAAHPEAESQMMSNESPIARKENTRDDDLAIARANQQVMNAKPAPATPAKEDAMDMKKTAASESGGAAPGARPKDEVAGAQVSSDKMKAKSSDLDPKLSVESYLTQKARLPKAARDNNVSGSVAVQFTIDENGKATNLQVIRGLGFGCDEEALRLIRLFTFEKKAAGRTLTVLAPFVR